VSRIAAMDLSASPTATPLLAKVERGRAGRKRLYGQLCRLGVFLRLLTFLNAVALIAAASYSVYMFGMAELSNASLTIEWRVRAGVEYALMALSGLFLLGLEHGSTANEAGMRSSLGLAFGGAGRFWLLLFLALISLPAVHTQRSDYEFYATGGAVGALVVSALLQAWLLSCAPEYRAQVVADLDTPKVQVDAAGFPQIYQRDEGAHLHLGVLLPGFASRETCTMAANCSALTIVGEIANLEAPFSPVGPDNSSSGPFGPFQREVALTHPVDITVPVESRMGLGILEFRFQKGFSTAFPPPAP